MYLNITASTIRGGKRAKEEEEEKDNNRGLEGYNKSRKTTFVWISAARCLFLFLQSLLRLDFNILLDNLAAIDFSSHGVTSSMITLNGSN
jgi:hypothetical protein